MKLNNKFIIIIPVYNAKDLIIECLSSIISQDFDDLGIIIRDDISNDGTDTIINDFFNMEGDDWKTNFEGKDILFIRNKTKFYPIGNTYDSVINHTSNDDAIIAVVDGDDRLSSSKSVKKIYDIYEKYDKWLVWSQHRNTNGNVGQSRPLPTDDIIYSTRNYWSVTHFRTSKAFLFKKLNKNDMMDPFVENSFYTYAGDAAFLYPFIEMCGNEKSYFLDEVLYVYNNELPTNEHHKSIDNAIKYGNYIKNNGNKYYKVNNG